MMERNQNFRSAWSAAAAAALGLALGSPAGAQELDICGCAGHPESLGDFRSDDDTTWPPGTTFDPTVQSGNIQTITIPLPEDGVLIFDSLLLANTSEDWNAALHFERNAANTPVTLLVTGDVTVDFGDKIRLNGEPGEQNQSTRHARGGLGGPGGHRGGDGGFAFVGQGTGGPGFGPGGGAPGDAAGSRSGVTGTWRGAADLLPVTGGSGGGGGSNTNTSSTCGNGAGGGGGGGILIAANGTIRISGNVETIGGSGNGNPFGGSCGYGFGGTGAGGAIRLVANAITGGGFLTATGAGGGGGRIRLEAFEITYSGSNNPTAARVFQPGPVAVLLAPAAAILSVGGMPVPEPPEGWRGSHAAADVEIPVPTTVAIEVATAGVPAGTLVDVRVKPHVGGPGEAASVLIDPGDCNGAGDCTVLADFDLAAGSYAIEAQATFTTP